MNTNKVIICEVRDVMKSNTGEREPGMEVGVQFDDGTIYFTGVGVLDNFPLKVLMENAKENREELASFGLKKFKTDWEGLNPDGSINPEVIIKTHVLYEE